MPSLTYYRFVLGLCIASSGWLGCSSDSKSPEPVDELFGGIDLDSMLIRLDVRDGWQLCEAAQERAEAVYADEEALRGACLMQAVSAAEVVAAIIQDAPSEQDLDDAVASCESELERCMGEGTTKKACRDDTLPDACGAQVQDYEACIDGALEIPAQLAATDCASYVREEGEREHVGELIDVALEPCTDRLAFCNDPSEWPKESVATVLFEAPKDEASNQEWLADAEALVEGYQRETCDDALVRDDLLDDAAASIANRAVGTDVMLNLDTLVKWKSLVAPRRTLVLQRFRAFLDEEAEVCTWVGYGLGIDGEPGESRHVVLVLAE